MRVTALTGLIILYCVLFPHVSMASTYTFTDLGTGFYAQSISSNGYIGGYKVIFESQGGPVPNLYQPVIWNKGYTPSPTINGSVFQGAFQGSEVGVAINSSGSVAGTAMTVRNGYWAYEAYLYSANTTTRLTSCFDYSFNCDGRASDINDSGQIVGKYHDGGGYKAFLYSNGNLTNLGTLGGGIQSAATSVNSNGVATGYSDQNWSPYTGSLDHAVKFKDGVIADLGTLGGGNSYAAGINDSEQIVGIAQTSSGDYHSFLYEQGVMQDLGTLGGRRSDARSINNYGQVVGNSYLDGFNWYRPFLYENGKMADLSSLVPELNGWINDRSYSIYAMDINNAGQIVGYATWYDSGNKTNVVNSFLLTPNNPVPEPSTLLLLGAGLGGVAICCRRIKK